MKKALLFSSIFSFGLLISSCNGVFGDLLGTSETGDGSDSTSCPHHGRHHKGNDHDADDTTIVKDTSFSNHIILQKH